MAWQGIVSCERVLLADDADRQLWLVSTDTGREIRIPKTAGIAGRCCGDGRAMNIADASADDRFNVEVDKRTGFKTQNVLAVPMLEEDRMDSEMHLACGEDRSNAASKDPPRRRAAARAPLEARRHLRMRQATRLCFVV